MKFFALFYFLVFTGSVVSGQNLIGYKDADIRKFMKENMKELNIDKVTNSKFNYLKYSDSHESQTLLFFLNADSVCNSIRMICDEPTKAQKIKEFNTKFKTTGVNKWIDSRGGKDFVIRVEDEPWSSIITIQAIK